MPVYMLVETTEVKDPQMYGEYIKQVPPTIQKFGGEYLARGGLAETICGDWKPARMILVKFDSMDKFRAWWNSPEYRAISPLRERSVKTNAVVVSGVE